MSAWSDHVTAPFQREFGSLWVVSDPDEILLAPTVSHILVERGFTLTPYRDPLGFRLLYETEILPRAEDTAFIVYVDGNAADVVPWDVMASARVHNLSIAELFDRLDSNAVRSIGTARFDDLWQIVCFRSGLPTLGTIATRDFLATNIYRVVPGLMRHADDLWVEAFDLFFRGESLPAMLAQHVAERACRPDDMSAMEAASILSDRVVFLERVQRDWDVFARAYSIGGQVPPDTVPFATPRIRTSLDSMVLDGTISPTMVDDIPQSVPAWMRIGMVRDELAARELVHRRIETLAADIPDSEASHRDWLRFAERHADVVDRSRALPSAESADLLEELAPSIDSAFFKWLEENFDSLGLNSFAAAPSIVHQVAPHMAHRRRTGAGRQALIVMDGLALDQWPVIERRLRDVHPDIAIDAASCFAWLPTTTGVSRQAIFTGDQPRSFAKTLGSTAPEPGAWRRFWLNEGVAPQHIHYEKGLGHAGSCDALIDGLIADRAEILGLVVDTVDELVHGETFGKRSLIGRIEHWLDLGEWDRLVGALLDAGYQIIVTADHGNVDAAGMGRPSEGSSAEERSERVRIYDGEALRQKSLATIPGSRIIQPGGLPETCKPLFASFGRAFIPQGRRAVVHGGTSIEEVIVPFVRISRKENT